jgi:hypothetical protein
VVLFCLPPPARISPKEGKRIMADYVDGLLEQAAILNEAKFEINLAREQSTKPRHLHIRTRRTVVQAARAVMAAVDVGFTELLPPSLPWKRQADGALSDATALTIWMFEICPVMRSRKTAAKAKAGAFDFPRIKTNDEGQVVGPDGTPLVVVDKIDPTTGKVMGQYLDGEAGAITDDYDEADAMVHLRCQAADWVDACDTAAELIREEASRAGNKTADEQPEPARPKGTVNQRMLEWMQKDPEAMGWKCRQWAEHLKCAKSTVVATPTWGNLKSIRLDNKAKRMVDKRRNRQPIDKRRD